ncbi:MAG: lysophospholipid acyltransferase family protein [bacterium]|jgi:1-acyl-sn-glycerol-3-phosphate acyltransferase
MKTDLLSRLGLFLGINAYTARAVGATLWAAWQGEPVRPAADANLRRWSDDLMRLMQIDCQVFNPHQVQVQPGQRYVMMSNHRSFFDIPVLYQALECSLRMVAKKELYKWPIWGRGLRIGEFIQIDRSDRDKAIASLEVAKDHMSSGIVVWIAPEGTRSRNGQLLPLKKGGFLLSIQSGATILPVGLQGTERVMPPDSFEFRLGERVEIHLGAPIDASAYTVQQRDFLMERVAAELRRLSGEIPQTSEVAFS